MARRAIDIVAAGPPSTDLYDPAAPTWALAACLAAHGHSVQVTFPGTREGVPAPTGVTTLPFPPVTAHVGSYLGDVELARAAGHHVRRTAELVVRDPAGLGALGHHGGRTRPVVSLVRSLVADAPGGVPTGPVVGRLVSRVLAWRERRDVRRLEREALAEATVVYSATLALRERLHQDYGVPLERVRVASPVVAPGPEAPGRAAARRLVGVPDDILLAVVLPPVEPTPTPSAAPALEAFRRTRPIFPGARLAVLGGPGPGGPGVVVLPARDAASVQPAIAAADVAISLPPAPRLDPGLVLALRAGVPCVAPLSTDVGEGSEKALRRAETSDSAELASVLAELLADPDERHALADAGREFVKRFEPERLALELETVGAPGAS